MLHIRTHGWMTQWPCEFCRMEAGRCRTGTLEVHTERMEVIYEYALPPWTSRIPVVGENDLAKAAKAPNGIEGIIIATSSSKKGGIVGMGGVARNATRNSAGKVVTSYSVTLGPGDEQNPYTAELAAIAMALECIPPRHPFRDVTVMTSNRSAVEVIRRPRQQSGQYTIRQIYDRAKCLQKRGCSVRVMWVPAKAEGFTLGPMAKAAAQRATKAECVVEIPSYQARSITLRLALQQQRQCGRLPEGVGQYSKRIDKALPGKHTRALYDSLKRKESDVIAQLRTGMIRLNIYLHRIGVAESDICKYGQAAEMVKHFLFRYKKWTI
ncbi:Endonuclease/exonuclease/phosphatase [Ilyonectria robusta]